MDGALYLLGYHLGSLMGASTEARETVVYRDREQPKDRVTWVSCPNVVSAMMPEPRDHGTVAIPDRHA
jgi:hypothetical protein